MSDSFWAPGPYSPWNSPGQNTSVGSLSLLQGIFPTQGSNPGLPNCRWILYQLSHRGSPRILEGVAYPFCSESSWPKNQTRSPALWADSLPTALSGKLPVDGHRPQTHHQEQQMQCPEDFWKMPGQTCWSPKYAFPRKSATYLLGWKINHYSINILWRLTVIFSFPWKENKIVNVLKCITQM